MLLWNIIRDFFVENLFGGRTSTGQVFSGYMGRVYATQGGNAWEIDSASFAVLQVTMDNRNLPINAQMSLGDYLSTTATIIVLIALCFFLFLCVRWIFRVFSSAFKGI